MLLFPLFQGPILDEKMTLPTSSLANTVIFSWKLAPLSVIPVSEFVVGSKMENELVFFPNPVPATNFSIVFMQTEGVRFIYRIRARAATGGLSPAIDMAWVTGDSLGERVCACVCQLRFGVPFNTCNM